jgi:cell division transport system permease protein
MLIKIGRTFKAGAQNFARNGWLTVATVSVIVITLFIVNVQAGMIVANNLLLEDIKDRVNISIYVNTNVSDEDIGKIREIVETYPEVEALKYVSKEEALDDFKKRNEDNETIRKAVEELGENPLGAVINIKAHNPDQYEAISQKIEGSDFSSQISKVNYQKYRSIIDSLNREIKSNQRVALILGITLSIIAVLITFNSIRITMYAHRQEVEIMRLVGASNNYIRMPFIWEGIFYGLIAATIAVPLSYFYLDFVASGDAANSILPFSNTKFIRTFLTDYFVANIIYVILFQFVFGMLLGIVSSAIAIRKYLKV